MTIFSPQILTIIIYMLLLMVITYIGYRATNNLSDYILGGRSFGPWVTALSAGSSDMSGWLLMALPGAIFIYGLSKSWIGVGLFLGAWVNWTFIASRLREKTYALGNAQTLPEYFAARFPQRATSLRLISALVIVTFFTFYCASGVVASGKLLQTSFGIDYLWAIWIGAGLTVIYVFFGGLFAVSWIDSLQAILMFIALIMVPFVTYLSIVDLSQAVILVGKENPNFQDFMNNITFISLLSSLAWGLGYFGQPHILVRFMAAKDSGKTIQQARLISLTWMILCLLGSISIGYYGALFLKGSGGLYETGTDNESIFLLLGEILLNPWLAGFLIAAVLSAIMSTLSSQLLIASASLMGDILPFFSKKEPSAKMAVFGGRICVLLIAIAAILLSYDPKSSILTMVGYAWAGFGCSFGTVIFMSLIWKKMTADGAIAGMVSGALMVLLWEIYGNAEIYSMIPAFILSLLMIIGVSLWRDPKVTENHEQIQ